MSVIERVDANSDRPTQPAKDSSPPFYRRWTFWRPILKTCGAAAILLPSLWGFGTKFVELVAIYRGEVDGAFAIAPIMNYLLASTGFALLLGWAACNGMFHDIEQPKRTMLETEAALDAASRRQGRYLT